MKINFENNSSIPFHDFSDQRLIHFHGMSKTVQLKQSQFYNLLNNRHNHLLQKHFNKSLLIFDPYLIHLKLNSIQGSISFT